MRRPEPSAEVVAAPSEGATIPAGSAKGFANLRLWGGVAFVVALTAVFIRPLYALMMHAAANELHSHIILIPFVSVYLLVIGRGALPKPGRPAALVGGLFALVGAALFAVARSEAGAVSENDYLALMAGSFLFFLWTGGFLFLGAHWMKAAAFPAFFLIFLVPLPDGVTDSLETASQLASAEASAMFFSLSGIPFFRQGLVFQIPGIAIKVAQECSGIRSSWVLLITSLLASHLFLRTNWRRAVIVAFVIPLGILRNGFRIMVIGWLCVEYGPQMIDSPIHHRGGPVFFVLSLIPLFALLWWLRRSEIKALPAAEGKG